MSRISIIENKNERLKTLEIIFDLYPELKKNKEEIIMNVLEKYGRPYKYILDKHIYKNKILYVDPDGCIFDKNLKFIGTYLNDTYYLLDDDFQYYDINKYDKILHYNK